MDLVDLVDLPEPVVLLVLVVGFVHLDPTVLDVLDLSTLTTTTISVVVLVLYLGDLALDPLGRFRFLDLLRLRLLRPLGLLRLVLVLLLNQSATPLVDLPSSLL